MNLPKTQDGDTFQIAYERILKALDRDPSEGLSTSLDAFRDAVSGKVALRELCKLRRRFGATDWEGLEAAIDRQIRTLTKALDDAQRCLAKAKADE